MYSSFVPATSNNPFYPGWPPPIDLSACLDNRLVRSAARSSATKEEVDNQADDWEEEDEEAPEKLVQGWATGLEDLDCGEVSACHAM